MRQRICLLIIAIALYGCAGIRPAGVPPPGRAPHGLKAEAVVEIKKNLLLRGHAHILVSAPDLFRIQVLGPFGSTMALFVSDGRTLYVFSGSREKEYPWNDPSFPYSFRAEDVVSSLLGEPPAGALEKSGYKVTSGGGSIKVTEMKDGKTALTVSMSDFRMVSGVRLPFDILIEDRRGALRIKYSSVEIDPSFAPDSFVIDPLLPAGR